MSTKHASVFFSVLLLLAVGACNKDGGEKAAADDVAWPDEPADGTPLALQFIALQGEGDEREARMTVFNFSDKAVTGFRARLNYLDESGKELEDFPWSQTATSLAAAKGHAEIEVGAFIPEATATVTADIDQVTFKDGSEWKRAD